MTVMECAWCGRTKANGTYVRSPMGDFCSQRCFESFLAARMPKVPVATCAYCGKPLGTSRRKAPDGKWVCGLKCYGDYLPAAEERAAERRREAEKEILAWADYAHALVETPLLSVKRFPPDVNRYVRTRRFALRVAHVPGPCGGEPPVPLLPRNPGPWAKTVPVPGPVYRFATWLKNLGVEPERTPAVEEQYRATEYGGGDFACETDGGGFLFFPMPPRTLHLDENGREEVLAEWLERNGRELSLAFAMDEFARAVQAGTVGEDSSWEEVRKICGEKYGMELPAEGSPPPSPKADVEAAETAARDDFAARASGDRPAEIGLGRCSWASKGGWKTLETGTAFVRNLSGQATGELRFAMLLAPPPPGNGPISDFRMGEAAVPGTPLPGGAVLSDVSVSMPCTGNPPTGEYRAVLVVEERSAGGRIRVVGRCRFPKTVRWTHR